MLKKFNIILVFGALFLLKISVVDLKMGDILGPAKIYINSAKTCNTARQLNVTNLQFSIFKRDGSMPLVIVNFTVYTSFKLASAKVMVTRLVGDRKVPMWRYDSKKPCEYIFFSTFIKLFMDSTVNCIFPKGNYVFKIDMNALMKKIFGNVFVFGRFISKTTATSEKGIIACIITEIDITPTN